tara:strand:+ start:318 stop:521 length:204 start_codon:yes stop_codon:yes gene_type:complete
MLEKVNDEDSVALTSKGLALDDKACVLTGVLTGRKDRISSHNNNVKIKPIKYLNKFLINFIRISWKS